MNKRIKKILRANENWTSGMRGQVLLTNLDPTSLGGKKRERERKREKGREFRERGSTFSLDFPAISPSNLARQEAKLIPTIRATHGCQYCGVSVTPRGRGFLLL